MKLNLSLVALIVLAFAASLLAGRVWLPPDAILSPHDTLAGLIVPYQTRAEAAKRALTGLFAPRLFAARTKSLVRVLIRLP